MGNYIFLYLAMLLSAGIGFVYGAVRYLRPHKPLYASMITLGVGCIMLGRTFSFLRILTGLEIEGVFHVGMLGTIGAFAFFFSANFGQIDSLVDGGEKEFIKYRILSFVSILISAAFFTFIVIGPAPTVEKISDGVVFAAITAASYFHIKHIIIPDIDYGVVRCQRGYNILALSYGILCMAEITAAANGMDIIRVTVCILQCVVTLILIPVMDRGVHKWSK